MREFDQFTDNQSGAIDMYERDQEKSDQFKKKTPQWVKLISIILITAIGISLAYLVFVHPINKLKISVLLCDNYTIKMIIPGGITSETTSIYVDGNIIKYNDQYYEIDGDDVYTYRKNSNGEWKREKSDDFVSSKYAEELLKRRNYRRVKGRLFAWEIKDEVDLGDIWSAGIESYDGKMSIVIYYALEKAYIQFTNFGKTKLTPPWQK